MLFVMENLLEFSVATDGVTSEKQDHVFKLVFHVFNLIPRGKYGMTINSRGKTYLRLAD